MPQLNSNAWNGAASYSKSWGTGPQNFHGQLFHLACSVWWSVPTKNQCVCNSSRWQAWNATRYWTKISKNEKGGHSDTSQGNPKGCSLERQGGCVHSDKHARSSCWRKFHPRIWPGYQTSCCRRLQCLHRGLWTSQTEWSTAMELPAEHEVDQETVFSPNRHDHSKRISYTQVMWRQNDAHKFPWNSCSRIDYPFPTGKFDSSWHFKGQAKSNCSVVCVHCTSKHRAHYISAGSVTLICA